MKREPPKRTTTFAAYAEGLVLIRATGHANRRPVLRGPAGAALLQCGSCGVCYASEHFYDLANPLSVSGKASECPGCSSRRRGLCRRRKLDAAAAAESPAALSA